MTVYSPAWKNLAAMPCLAVLIKLSLRAGRLVWLSHAQLFYHRKLFETVNDHDATSGMIAGGILDCCCLIADVISKKRSYRLSAADSMDLAAGVDPCALSWAHGRAAVMAIAESAVMTCSAGRAALLMVPLA